MIGEYPDVFATPVDVAIDKDGERVEMDVREMGKGDKIYDLGPKTVEYYSKLIAGAGTVFISGPAGFFEKEKFQFWHKGFVRISFKFNGYNNCQWRSLDISIKATRLFLG